MESTQLLAMVLLFCCTLVRPFAMRGAALHFNPFQATFVTGVFMCIVSAALWPLYAPVFHEHAPTLLASPTIILMSVIKGVSLCGTIAMMQVLRRYAAGSAEFRGPLTLGLMAICNAFLGENLNTAQWASVAILSALGVLFVLRGGLACLSLRHKILFACLVLVGVIPGMADQIVMTQTHWYIQLMFSGMGVLVSSIIFARGRGLRAATQSLACLKAGSVWVVTEVLILMMLVTYVPVTVGGMAMMMSVPTIMLIGSLRWQDGNWRMQTAFGALAYMAVMPIFIA